jgi:porin
MQPARCASVAAILCAASSLLQPQTTSKPSSQSPPSAESLHLIHTKTEPEKPILSLPDFFARAAHRGIYFHTFLNEELAANPKGGINQGASASQYLTFGTGIDLQRLIGWQGGALHAIVIAFEQQSAQ